MEIRSFYFVVAGALLALKLVDAEEKYLCLDSNGYSLILECSASLSVKIESVSYGVNNNSCTEVCCVTPDTILCEKASSTPQGVSDTCDGQQKCTLESGSHLKAEEISCPNEFDSTQATYAVVVFQCIKEVTEVPTTPSTQSIVLTNSPADGQSSARPSTTSSQQEVADGSQDKNAEKESNKSDMGLVIGLSVAGGIVIIVIVVAIAVFTTRSHRKHNTGSQSQNSTKTLASSDMEAGQSPDVPQQGPDIYGFERPNPSQQERLQKRNDDIKRNLSFKSEESKNKRPAKLSKNKSKSKSSSLDQLNSNNSNNKTQAATQKEKKTAEKSANSNETSKKSEEEIPSTVDISEAKSSSNLLNI